jgi:hypothetical protein
VERVREGELDAVDVDGSALVRGHEAALVDALPPEPAAQLDLRDDLRAVLL